MKAALQGIAFFLILALALAADDLMDCLGAGGFIKTAGRLIIVSSLLIWLSERPGKKRKPPAGGGSSNGRRNQRKR